MYDELKELLTMFAFPTNQKLKPKYITKFCRFMFLRSSRGQTNGVEKISFQCFMIDDTFRSQAQSNHKRIEG